MADDVVDDAFRTVPLGPPPAEGRWATCPKDGSPLVSTLEFRKAEFVCMTCRTLLGFMAPVAKPGTPELLAAYEEAKAAYELERDRRQAGTCTSCGGSFGAPSDRTEGPAGKAQCRACADADPTVEVAPW